MLWILRIRQVIPFFSQIDGRQITAFPQLAIPQTGLEKLVVARDQRVCFPVPLSNALAPARA